MPQTTLQQSLKAGLHPRNRFRNGYDFPALIVSSPELAAFVKPHAHGGESIDYANPKAVKALNVALLKQAYRITHWDIPAGALCPPIPGRSDYLHYLADLLSGGNERALPRGESVKVLDIGTGANLIYPLIGVAEYGWSFVGTDVDPAAIKWAKKLAATNKGMIHRVDCRLQTSPTDCFKGVAKPSETFDLCMCNPPFHASAAEAAAATTQKLKGLEGRKPKEIVLNFGGRGGELWCEGGELAFVRRMIQQSAEVPHLCRWFTSLVSKSIHLPPLLKALTKIKPTEVRTIDMAQGQKKSRILAWTFQRSS